MMEGILRYRFPPHFCIWLIFEFKSMEIAVRLGRIEYWVRHMVINPFKIVKHIFQFKNNQIVKIQDDYIVDAYFAFLYHHIYI